MKSIKTWQNPFNEDSIWNKKINCKSDSVHATFRPSSGFGFSFNKLIEASAADKKYNIMLKTENGDLPTQQVVSLPDGALLDGNTECTVVLGADKDTVIELRDALLNAASGTVFCTEFARTSLNAEGTLGVEASSGLSALGGTIRASELTSDEPINHALKLKVPFTRYLYYTPEVPGFKAPATRADSFASNSPTQVFRYSGTTKEVVIGTLLTLPDNVTAESCALRSKVGKKLFEAIKTYGAYVVGSTVDNFYVFVAEQEVENELENDIGQRCGGFFFESMSQAERDYAHDLGHIMEKVIALK